MSMERRLSLFRVKRRFGYDDSLFPSMSNIKGKKLRVNGP